MKKFWLGCLFLLIFSLNVNDVLAGAQTLGDLKKELQALKSEQAANNNAKKKTESQIQQENSNIASANAEVEKAESDIENAKISIEKSNEEIEKTKEETESLLVFYEVMNGDNTMFNFAVDATSINDLILRTDAITQIVSYNKNRLNELEGLIKKNEDLQVDLAKKQVELEEKIVTYQNSLSSLKDDLSSLLEVSLDISDQIKAQQELIKYYEDIGCTDDEALSKCVEDIANNSKWLKPTAKGYVSSGFGYRSFYLNGKPYSDYHNANDIAGNAGGTPIYAAAGGTVAAVIRKASCGGNQVYIHVRVQGQPFTLTYAHMMDVYVNVGDKVTNQDVIGTVGGGGKTLKVNGGWDTCSTGYHLHFGVAKGFYLGGGADGYSSYSTYVAKSIQPPMLPNYGNWFYSRF